MGDVGSDVVAAVVLRRRAVEAEASALRGMRSDAEWKAEASWTKDGEERDMWRAVATFPELHPRYEAFLYPIWLLHVIAGLTVALVFLPGLLR